MHLQAIKATPFSINRLVFLLKAKAQNNLELLSDVLASSFSIFTVLE